MAFACYRWRKELFQAPVYRAAFDHLERRHPAKADRLYSEILKVGPQLPALIEVGFVDRATNVIVFGLPGRGENHFLAALERELILRHSKRVGQMHVSLIKIG